MAEKILIFTPGYNVAKNIGKVMEGLFSLKNKIGFDMLYVDNNSSDSSAGIVEEVSKKHNIRVNVIRNPFNKGYGGSQKVAFRYAFDNGYDYLVEYDGDLQYPFEAIPDLYNKIKETGSSIVFGSRVTSKENIRQMPKWKQFGNQFLNVVNNWSFRFGVSEIHTGFRIYDLRKIKGMRLEACHDDYRWTIDSVVEIMKLDKKFSEIPVKAYYHKDASAPSPKALIKFSTYMFTRAMRYKLLGN